MAAKWMINHFNFSPNEEGEDYWYVTNEGGSLIFRAYSRQDAEYLRDVLNSHKMPDRR